MIYRSGHFPDLVLNLFLQIETKMNPSISFNVENVTRAENPLPEVQFKTIAKAFSKKWESASHQDKSLVDLGNHAFLKSMHQAYADHRPFVLSPDMIWLLISQGFAHHVNHNAEALRDQFVNFQGKKELIVKENRIRTGKEDSPWHVVFPQFTEQIASHTGKELIQHLTADFTTTGPTEKVVSEITIMDAMKPYFKYIVMSAICGIPRITLEGTAEDWGKVIEKTRFLEKFQLDWWIPHLIPVLQRIKATVEGNLETKFWKDMFKVKTESGYGAFQYINGWIVRFFPYTEIGEQRDLHKMYLHDMKELPSECVNVPFEFREQQPDFSWKIFQMEFIGGFVGAKQHPKTLALRPEIGWMVGHKVKENPLAGMDKEDLRHASLMYYNLEEFPRELLEVLEGIEVQKEVIGMEDGKEMVVYSGGMIDLELSFQDRIEIPEELKELFAFRFRLNGKITEADRNALHARFPNVRSLIINGEYYNKEAGRWEPSDL